VQGRVAPARKRFRAGCEYPARHIFPASVCRLSLRVQALWSRRLDVVSSVLRLPLPATAIRKLHQIGIHRHTAEAVVLPVERDHRGRGQRIELGAPWLFEYLVADRAQEPPPRIAHIANTANIATQPLS